MSRMFSSPPPELPQNRTGTQTKTYAIKVITPMFGGGVKAGENAPSMLIRPTAIRGHLRFWWRALRGGDFSSIGAMREEEQSIWGSTTESSKVAIQVTVNNNGQSEACAVFLKGAELTRSAKESRAYALFLFRENLRSRQITLSLR